MYDFIFWVLVVGYFTICYYLPDIFGGERDPECLMRTGFANAMFGWVIATLIALSHLGFVIGYKCKEGAATRNA